MIDEKTGDISVPVGDFRIHSGMDENDVKATLFYEEFLREVRDMKTGYVWYSFAPVFIMKRKILLTLGFHNTKLYRVDFTVVSEELPSSWDNWSEQGELKKKQINEEFLKEIFKNCISKKLQPKCDFDWPEERLALKYDFKWGDVISTYDARSGGSYVFLCYKDCQ